MLLTVVANCVGVYTNVNHGQAVDEDQNKCRCLVGCKTFVSTSVMLTLILCIVEWTDYRLCIAKE